MYCLPYQIEFLFCVAGKENGILDARKTTKEEVGLLMTNLQNGGADNE